MEDSYTYLVLFALCSRERDNKDIAHPVVVVGDTNAYLYACVHASITYLLYTVPETLYYTILSYCISISLYRAHILFYRALIIFYCALILSCLSFNFDSFSIYPITLI